MHKLIITIICALIVALPSASLSGSYKQIPTGPRAREAIARITPLLKEELAQQNLNFGSPIFIRIFKKEKELEMWVDQKEGYKLFKTYPICTYGFRGIGPKIRQGDGKAPEGFYFIRPASLNPASKFHLSFNLGYPNQYDRSHNRTGSALMVHGDCVSIGCYAMTDEAIEEIYTLVDAALRNGQPFFRAHIFPFKMNIKNMNKYKKSKWYSFWANLKEGYDFFENNGKKPPNVEVKNKRYVFSKS